MTQQTLGIISLNVKDDILNRISTTPKVKLVYEQQFDLTAATSLEMLGKSISKTLPVYGFVLEGSNAIRDWSQITSSTASLSKSALENAQHQVDWFKNLTRPTSATTTTKVKTPATSSVTPSTKRVNDGMKPTSGRRGSLASSTLAATSSSKKLLNTTSKGGVIKNTPPVSVLTGRTRKPSRLTEKRPVVAAAAPDKVDSVKEEEHSTEEIEPEVQQEAVSSPSTPTPPTRPFEEAVEHAEAQEAPCDTAMIQEQQIVSYPSTCSSAATDEHDAEVAATTSKKDTTSIASSTQTTAINNSSVPLLCNSGRSSFSPTSIASLPRPETPEVDQLRLRFETIIQTSAPVGQAQEIAPRRPSSKLSQHEFASRIKEMKPRGPVGSRVKSMVELFMDENLNKWEF
ncbi:hypothetical protein FB192DRAFT_1420595 [Mucor lusitanicus]|uniref:Uncharacterized protein n=1 Tax=Mucor circinelloides f. lusitanicus TaxID=29924 RepID=A0A8H4F6G5_MUCCL|nr:hypothetical protein FB192DRAFT_1420595 [Mucor lusitanicus]